MMVRRTMSNIGNNATTSNSSPQPEPPPLPPIITGLSGININTKNVKKTSLDVIQSAKGISSSPCLTTGTNTAKRTTSLLLPTSTSTLTKSSNSANNIILQHHQANDNPKTLNYSGGDISSLGCSGSSSSATSTLVKNKHYLNRNNNNNNPRLTSSSCGVGSAKNISSVSGITSTTGVGGGIYSGTATSESESDRETCSNNNSTINSTRKSAFLKAKKKKEKLRIRFEVEETDHQKQYHHRQQKQYQNHQQPLTTCGSGGIKQPQLCTWDPGPERSSGDSGRASSSSKDLGVIGIGGGSSSSSGLGLGGIIGSSQTLLSKKPKRSKSLKKILTKSRSFVGNARDSISRAELVAKYQEQSESKSIPVNPVVALVRHSSSLSQHHQSLTTPSTFCSNKEDFDDNFDDDGDGDEEESRESFKRSTDKRYWDQRYQVQTRNRSETRTLEDDDGGLGSNTGIICKNCGTSTLEYPKGKKRYGNKIQPLNLNQNQKPSTSSSSTWQDTTASTSIPTLSSIIAPSGVVVPSGGDIHFHGRYSKLPMDHHDNLQKSSGGGVVDRDFLSLNLHSDRLFKHHLHPNQIQKPKGQKEKKFFKQYKGFHINFSRKEYGVQQQAAVSAEKMAHENGAEYSEHYKSYYDCRIPRPKLKFVVPTHSYGVVASPGGKIRRRAEMTVDVSGFSEISLSDGNEDGAYGSGSGGSRSGSSRLRSENSSDETISEFEREQEQIALQDERDYVTQVERIHSTEENSPIGQFPSDYTALYSCEKGIVLKGNTRRLLSFKKSYLPSLLSKSSPKGKIGEYTEFLKSLPLFRKLSNGFLAKLGDHISEASYECGEYILRQGSRGVGLFILTVGTAKVTFLSNLNGEDIYLRTLHPGDTFGEKSLQGDKMNMVNIIANDETVSCVIIAEEGFELLMAKSADFRLRFGDQSSKKNIIDEDVERIELEDLRLISTLGIGGFGRVELVTLASDTNRSFALKQMKKCQIVATRQVEHIKSEKAILLETNCDFITKLFKTYKDAKYLYMLMECCLGGELWTILRDRGNFDDNTVRFYVGCVLEALKYLHSRNIIYRDLKPENLLLDAKGYLKLVDFGFAKKLEGNKTWTFCGTPEYVAPEIILNKGHDVTADYWSLGVLMYELLTGTPPFVGGDPMRTYKLILKGIDFINFPQSISKNAYNLIRKLCRENPLDRLGSQRGGISDIKKHKWFDGLEWQALRSKTLTPPILPYVRGPHDCGNFDEYPPDRSGTPPDDCSGWDWDF